MHVAATPRDRSAGFVAATDAADSRPATSSAALTARRGAASPVAMSPARLAAGLVAR